MPIAAEAKPAIVYKGKPIRMISQVRLLGIIVDDCPSWSAHVNYLHSKLARKIGLLRRSSRQLTLHAKRQFLISVTQPDLEYAAGAVIPTMSASNRSRLLALWSKAARRAAGADWQSEIKPLLDQIAA